MTDHAARLEPFLLLARSTKGAAAAKVINDATAASGVYTFAELLDVPGIRQLETDPNLAKSYLLLQLFAYGTLDTYSSHVDAYPPLSPTHLTKLKHLTLVSLALQQRAITYDALLAALQLDSIRELEDLIIDVMYAGLLGGKMHHHERVLHVDWVSGRDVPPSDLPKMQQQLEEWCATAQNLLSALDERIGEVRSAAHHESAALAAYKAFRNDQFADVQKESNQKKDNRWGGGQGPRSSGWGGGDVPGAGGGEGGGFGRFGSKGNVPAANVSDAGAGGGFSSRSNRGNKRPRD